MKAQATADYQRIRKIIFGGTFDPPHLGHLQMAKLALSKFPKAKLIVLPAAVPPIAGSASTKAPTRSLEERIELCRAGFGTIAPDRLEILDIEKTIEAPNYTLKTLRALGDSQDQVLLIGQDQLRVFQRWHKPIEILKLSAIAVIERVGQVGPPLPATIRQVIIDLGGHVSSQKDEVTQASWPDFKQVFYALSGSVSDAASEVIRQAIHEESAFAQWLTPEVVDLIQKRGWYTEKP